VEEKEKSKEDHLIASRPSITAFALQIPIDASTFQSKSSLLQHDGRRNGKSGKAHQLFAGMLWASGLSFDKKCGIGEAPPHHKSKSFGTFETLNQPTIATREMPIAQAW